MILQTWWKLWQKSKSKTVEMPAETLSQLSNGQYFRREKIDVTMLSARVIYRIGLFVERQGGRVIHQSEGEIVAGLDADGVRKRPLPIRIVARVEDGQIDLILDIVSSPSTLHKLVSGRLAETYQQIFDEFVQNLRQFINENDTDI